MKTPSWKQLKFGLELVKKLDEERWSKDIYILNYCEPEASFKDHEKILIHWLTYIFDYRMAAGVVGVRGSREFSHWVKEY